jgi:chlorobactene glucosyltransferase
VYDDDSNDDTYALCVDFAAAHPHFSVIKGLKLPAGWLGKTHACDRLAKKAKGDYFLFMDADEIVGNGLLNSAVHRMQLNKLGLLSLLPNQKMQTLGEKTTVPLMNYMVLNLLPLRLIYLAKTALVATACGQFMLFDAALYQANHWHSKVKDKIVEDAEIMKLVKTRGYNGELLLANGMISCRMYKSYMDGINGFSKNVLALFNYNIISLLLNILLTIVGPMLVIMTLNFPLIFFMAGLIILTRIITSLSSGQSAWQNVLLHPLQMLNIVIISFLSIQKYLTKTVVWKGRQV